MAETPNYSWPPMDKRKVMGKSYRRVDGPQKASGRARYSSDFNRKDLLFGAYNTSPHASARVVSVDTAEAEKMKGVMAVHVVAKPGTMVQWAGAEIAAVAAVSEEIARDAARKIKVQYEVQPHVVQEADPSRAGSRMKAAGEQVTGDPEKAFQEAEAVSEGEYGIPVVTHCCLETHGQVIEAKGDTVNFWASTQAVSNLASTLAPNIKVPVANIKVKMDYIGGGFGSKFAADAWAVAAYELSKKAGGRPVKLFLDRATDQMIAGNRPSAFAKIKVGGKKDGTITAWQSQSWATGGMGGGGLPPIPYVFTDIPNKRLNHSSVAINAGPQRAWRAPNNQQAAFLTCCAIEDFAAKIGMDPLEVYLKATNYANKARQDTYRYQLKKAAEMADWKKLWKPRGSATGTMRRGLGIGVNAWGGGGHASKCLCTINQDGSVEVALGTQDLGTGTKTIILQVAAETLGLQMGQVKLLHGDNSLPPSGASGGSTTVGGVSSSTRKAAVNALAKLYTVAAPALGVPPEQLEAVDGRIQVKGTPSKGMTWQQACRKIAAGKISEMGENEQRNPMGLNASGVGGIHIADLSVDVETGVVKMNKLVAVNDCGLIINPRLAESQCYGGCIMGICTGLYEERVMDAQTGRMLNADLEFYKLAGAGDIGEIVVHLDIRPENDSRGVIGLGEPAAIGIHVAIANAVTNAIGVRVGTTPVTPERVLAALERRNA